MIRTILFFVAAFFLVVLGILIWPVAGFFLLIKKKPVCDRIIFFFVRIAAYIVYRINGARIVEANGTENLPDEPCLYVSNHRSIFDIVVLFTFFKRPTGFVSKKEMDKVPVFNIWMRFLNCLFLDRSDIRQGLETINKGAELLRSGVSMVIFPEGTRKKDYEDPFGILPFHGGSLKLAVKSGVPIIPVAIYGTEKCFEDDFPKMHASPVKISFGAPIRIKELDKEDRKFLVQYVEKTISGMMENYKTN